jgi:putative effector of murein hydrolase
MNKETIITILITELIIIITSLIICIVTLFLSHWYPNFLEIAEIMSWIFGLSVLSLFIPLYLSQKH